MEGIELAIHPIQPYGQCPHGILPVAIETLGVIGHRSLDFLKDLGRRISQRTGEEKATQYLLQQLAVAVSVAVRGSVGGSSQYFVVS